MSDCAIETSGLQKRYGSKVAVADLSLQVQRGEIFGFLGPNGAGKSTSVKMLLGLVKPSSGTALVLGKPIGNTATMGRLGFLPEHFRFHEWLQAHELLDLHGRLYGMDAAARRRRIPELLDLVGLTEHAQRRLEGFSKGMLQRIGLAQALLNSPDLVFLDEPTSALDPFGRKLVRGIIRDLKHQGTTVFLNSHLLSEVEATCDRVSIIKQGRVLESFAVDAQQQGRMVVDVRVDAVTESLLHALQELTDHAIPPAAAPTEHGDGGVAPDAAPVVLELSITDEEVLPVIAARVVESGARLYALTPRQVSLEQRFIEIVGIDDSGQ
jgi:ABC-2 type transport system ATP-binding protein